MSSKSQRNFMVTMNVSWVEERNLDLCQAGKKIGLSVYGQAWTKTMNKYEVLRVRGVA